MVDEQEKTVTDETRYFFKNFGGAKAPFGPHVAPPLLPNELKHLDCSSSHSHTYIFFLHVLTSKIMSTISIKLKMRMVNFPVFFFTSKFQYE